MTSHKQDVPSLTQGLRGYLEYLKSCGVEEVPLSATLEQVREDISDCRRCKLHKGRKTIMFGSGNPQADLVFVGEAPSVEENSRGLPFDGKAGKKLAEIIEKGMGFSRDDVYILNIIKCCPPGNREPEVDEIRSCYPFLVKQIRAIKPRAIVALGGHASSTLIGRPVSIIRERGAWREFEGIKLMPTFHPAYLLSNYTEEVRTKMYKDVRAVVKELKKGV